jgi:thiamine-phosphate pyrophosphorylase
MKDLRIIDANLNRASEAARVLEDCARFLLDDPALSRSFKELRHGIRAAAAEIGADPAILAAWRDTAHDVGTQITTASELQRSTTADIAAAAGSRFAEAVRCLEEFAKLASPQSAARLERARYASYELTRALLGRLPTGRAAQWKLCVLLTAELCAGRDWEMVASACIDGGADCLQLREKSLDSGELLARARRLVAIARPHRCAVIINDRPDIALLCGADGVHVGQTDLSVPEIRKLAGHRLLIGVSTSNTDEALAALRAGADYCGLGPMFASSTKQKPTLAGPAYLRDYLARPELAHLPHLAISGINPATARELGASGCRGVAISSAACAAPDPARACREIVASLTAC